MGSRFSGPATGAVTARTAAALSKETLSVNVRRLDGSELQVSVSVSCSIMDLYSMVHAAMGLKKTQAIKLTFGTTALESASEATLQTVGIQDGHEVSVTILSEILVLRHVYRAGGGAPPWRLGNLVSTEEVYLNGSQPLCQQWETLVPRGDSVHLMTSKVDSECSYCGGKGIRYTSHRDRCENCEGDGRLQGAPKLWVEADKEEKRLASDEPRLARDVFEERNAVGIISQMRGMD